MRLVVTAVLISAATVSYAQNPAYNRLHQPNDPYTLVVEYKTVQTLSNGSHITTTRKESVLRDSLGRTRIENESRPLGSGRNFVFRNVSVTDTVANRSYTWIESSQVSQHEYFSRDLQIRNPRVVPQNGNGPLANPQPPAAGPQAHAGQPQTPPVMPKHTVEKLGTRNVQGFTCEATRTTTTYPIDFFGNDQPLITTEEGCYSSELTHQLAMTRDDARNGLETMTVVSLSRVEPGAALFQPPAGYTERVQPPPAP